MLGDGHAHLRGLVDFKAPTKTADDTDRFCSPTHQQKQPHSSHINGFVCIRREDSTSTCLSCASRFSNASAVLLSSGTLQGPKHALQNHCSSPGVVTPLAELPIRAPWALWCCCSAALADFVDVGICVSVRRLARAAMLPACIL